ncbi:uncharacterized protein [Rutidosis leptorrhynchoides]|uniref:uncharacterized protein n=1 Tax=Rutidosis leptorrhynchoides TaxID=125765 RepID=UPI003A993BB9
MAANSQIHPATTVNNIRNFIPIVLEMENGLYESWAELFKIYCRAFSDIDHIIPESTDASVTASSSDITNPPTPPNPALWDRLDAIVLQWIYGTISKNMFRTVMKTNSTAQQAWDRLKNLFHDNCNSYHVYLLHKFHNTKLDNFSNFSDYCEELKVISDQLSNVGPTIEEDHLVL